MEKEDVRSDLGRVVSSARHLLSLINNVLDLSKIEAGKMDIHLEPTDMEMLVLEISATISPLMDKANIKFDIEQDEWQGEFNTDAVKLKQVLINLLSNASKFTENGEVLFSAKRKGQGVEFIVRDNGVGMSDEELSTLFSQYQQANSTAGKFGGTGLGLSIVKQFIELMGGTVEVTSRPGEGTEFSIYLPD
jgi:signal transduction histidine kinase